MLLTPRAPIPAEAHVNRRKGSKPVAVKTASVSVAVIEGEEGEGENGVAKEEPEEEEEEVEPEEEYVPPPVSNQELSILYAFTTPPPLSALSALASRLALASSVSASSHASLQTNLPLLEQCLVHESFWLGVKELPSAPEGSATRRYTQFHDTPLNISTSPSTIPRSQRLYAHNGALATLGNAVLGVLASELLLASFPHLPTRVTKAALTMYVGPKSLAAVAASWGVAPSRLELRTVGREDVGKTTKGDRAYGHLVGGVGGGKRKESEIEGAAGMGLIRWNRRVSNCWLSFCGSIS